MTKAERLASGDPRRSVEERYGSQEGYNCVVRHAARQNVRDRFLRHDELVPGDSIKPAVAPNHVVSVLQKGYLINDRVLRPALVTVAQA